MSCMDNAPAVVWEGVAAVAKWVVVYTSYGTEEIGVLRTFSYERELGERRNLERKNIKLTAKKENFDRKENISACQK